MALRPQSRCSSSRYCTEVSGTAPAWTPDGSGLVYQNAARQLVVAGAQVTADEDIFPFPVRFLPDGRFLYTADGKIRTRDALGSNRADIDFRAELKLRRPVFKHPMDRGFVNFDTRPVRGISAPVLSPKRSISTPMRGAMRRRRLLMRASVLTGRLQTW